MLVMVILGLFFCFLALVLNAFPTLILRWSLHGYFFLLLLYLKRWSFLVLLCYLSFFGSGASDARSTSLGGVSELHYS